MILVYFCCLLVNVFASGIDFFHHMPCCMICESLIGKLDPVTLVRLGRVNNRFRELCSIVLNIEFLKTDSDGRKLWDFAKLYDYHQELENSEQEEKEMLQKLITRTIQIKYKAPNLEHRIQKYLIPALFDGKEIESYWISKNYRDVSIMILKHHKESRPFLWRSLIADFIQYLAPYIKWSNIHDFKSIAMAEPGALTISRPHLPKHIPLLNYLSENDVWDLDIVKGFPLDELSVLYSINVADERNVDVLKYVIEKSAAIVHEYAPIWIDKNYSSVLLKAALSVPFSELQIRQLIARLALNNLPIDLYLIIRNKFKVPEAIRYIRLLENSNENSKCLKAPKGIKLSFVLEVALMISSTEKVCKKIIRHHSFRHDEYLLLLSLSKRCSASFIVSLISSNGPKRYLFKTICTYLDDEFLQEIDSKVFKRMLVKSDKPLKLAELLFEHVPVDNDMYFDCWRVFLKKYGIDMFKMRDTRWRFCALDCAHGLKIVQMQTRIAIENKVPHRAPRLPFRLLTQIYSHLDELTMDELLSHLDRKYITKLYHGRNSRRDSQVIICRYILMRSDGFDVLENFFSGSMSFHKILALNVKVFDNVVSILRRLDFAKTHFIWVPKLIDELTFGSRLVIFDSLVELFDSDEEVPKILSKALYKCLKYRRFSVKKFDALSDEQLVKIMKLVPKQVFRLKDDCTNSSAFAELLNERSMLMFSIELILQIDEIFSVNHLIRKYPAIEDHLSETMKFQIDSIISKTNDQAISYADLFNKII